MEKRRRAAAHARAQRAATPGTVEARRRAAARSAAWRDANPGRHKALIAAWHAANPERSDERKHDSHLRKTYGMTLAEYDALAVRQNGVCAICARPCPTGARLSVDRDHETGHVRGLLCRWCNTSLGGFRDDPLRLAAAIHYLQRGV